MRKREKGIPRDVAERGYPDEIRCWMALANGRNISDGKLPQTYSGRLKDDREPRKKRRKRTTIGVGQEGT